MSSEDFLNEYINTCISEGTSSPKDICQKALNEIQELNKQIAEANALRIKVKNLHFVLRNFNHESTRKQRRNNIVTAMNNTLNNNIEDISYKALIINICEYFENIEESVTPRVIMDTLCGVEQNAAVYMAIKWLCDRGILTRNEDRTLNKGLNWEMRPMNEILEQVS
jgi:hypothetical protein